VNKSKLSATVTDCLRLNYSHRRRRRDATGLSANIPNTFSFKIFSQQQSWVVACSIHTRGRRPDETWQPYRDGIGGV